MTEQVSHTAYRNVIDTCRTVATRNSYAKHIRLFQNYLRLPHDDYDKLLEKDPQLIQQDIIDYIRYMRARGLSSSSITTYLCGIWKFYEMNDVTLKWRKINQFKGDDDEDVHEDRPYTHSEIKLLTEHTGLRNKAIILLQSSSGCRVGAIHTMRVKDLEPIDSFGIYKVTYYPRSKKFKYFSFCTPECRQAIDAYLEYRRRWDERITEESPLFRKEYDKMTPSIDIRSISYDTIRHFMRQLLQDCGLRGPTVEGKRQQYPVMENHGLRKFFETNAFRAGMNEEYIRRLMGHHGGKNTLSDTYNKIREEELLSGDSRHVGYIGIIDQLTINEENRLQRKVKSLEREVTRFDHMQKQIEELNKRLGL